MGQDVPDPGNLKPKERIATQALREFTREYALAVGGWRTMGREIGRKHDSLIGFARGTTQEPNPTTRKRLEALYRVWAPVLEEKSEVPVLHFKGLMLELADLLPDDLDEAEAVLRQAMRAGGTEGEEDPRAAALRPHLLRILLKMVDTSFALLHRYDKQLYKPKKKRAPKKAQPDAPDYLAGIPPGEGAEPPKPKRRARRPPTEPK